MGACLLSNFLLFRMRYERYLTAFRCVFFMKILMVDFGDFTLAS